jgi:DNA-binding GntR family transcriptional regulator
MFGMTARSTSTEKRTLADDAYAELKSRVMRAELAPGAKLSIDGLAKQLAFSQTPIREALARLESEGLLARRPLSGYTVEPLLSAAEFADLFEIRLMLEPLAARRAAEHGAGAGPGAPTDTERLLAAARTPAPGADQLLFTEADRRFHHEVAGRSGSVQLAKAIRRLDAHLHLHRAYIEPESIGETEAEHLAVAEAIIAKKPLAAEEAMRRHLERSRTRHAAAFTAATAQADSKPKRAKATR